MKQTLILLKPHTHADTAYSAGSELEVDATTAQWLIGLAIAEPKPTVQPKKPQPQKES